MDWIQFIIFIGSTVGLFFWNRSESRADMRHMDAKLDQNRKDTNDILRGIQDEVKGIQNEMKDFHGRLCSIEERNRK